MVEDALKEYAYDTELAGLGYDISNHLIGIKIKINSYSKKPLILFKKILFTIRDLVIRSDHFEIVKKRLVRDLQNWQLESPYEQISVFMK
jgi:insulysin